jgi:hypothetical protein
VCAYRLFEVTGGSCTEFKNSAFFISVAENGIANAA